MYMLNIVFPLFFHRDMAESAYRDAVAEAGKGQTKLTEGWKVLGLDKEAATRIFEETKKLGFLSRQELFEKDKKDMMKAVMDEEKKVREDLISSIDKDGNLIDPDSDVDPDKLINPDDLDKDIEEDDSDDDVTSGGAKECGKCGYTMFIAKGREGRFFSSGFTCPQCGAGRDQFKDIEVDL
jgi:rubredoxin